MNNSSLQEGGWYYHPALPIWLVHQTIAIGPSPPGEPSPWPNWKSDWVQHEWQLALNRDIKANGIRDPLILWNYSVRKGGSRLRAAKALGIETVPTLLYLSNGQPIPTGARALAPGDYPVEGVPDVVSRVQRSGGEGL